MFIRRIEKSNKNSDKVYTYYRPVHTYKVGKKVRHPLPHDFIMWFTYTSHTPLPHDCIVWLYANISIAFSFWQYRKLSSNIFLYSFRVNTSIRPTTAKLIN